MRKLGVIGAILLTVALCGCKDPYQTCLTAGTDIATGIAQGMKTVDSVRQQGLITPAEESSVLDYLEFANKADEAFKSCADAAHTAGSKAGAFTACATTFNTALNNPTELALLHVSNAQASQNISTIVAGITTGVNAIITGLNGA